MDPCGCALDDLVERASNVGYVEWAREVPTDRRWAGASTAGWQDRRAALHRGAWDGIEAGLSDSGRAGEK